MSQSDSTKRCPTCGKTKTLECFAKDRTRSDGRRATCKECQRAYKKRYRAENQHVIKAHTERYYRENKDSCLEATRRWRERNRAAIAEYDRARRSENPEALRAYYRDNKARFDHHRRQRQARLRGAPGSHTAEEVARMIEDQGGLCAYCECSLEGGFHVDHMLPISRRGTNDWSNIAVTCPLCNWSKNNKTTEEYWDYLIGRLSA